ncbi:iron (metal) dependent repressor, DtxR family [Desulfatibacillum aliphaticivorans]|uniref:Transcriptional regulator MntR n=1 Tax=Desulfatibacillum aliphaticivorans TaxID=218208 RepID=B8FKQ2_DESAL|nr:metal-dependent transcriptional regulator [Desulfatibacillum aliphaticivorans]ACL04424.1 iron (metal) dependent repressor, DtxR family [Desulfatibacillum aliphaticivorans]
MATEKKSKNEAKKAPAKVERPLTSVMEDYLETIYQLNQEKEVVRVRDIAKAVGVKMPTVTSMLKTLGKKGYVHYEKYEYVRLTSDGVKVGKEMRRRHEILYQFLTDILRIDQTVADDEACKMEHGLSPETLESFTDFLEFIHVCPRAGEGWLDHFEEFRKRGNTPNVCSEADKMCAFPCKLNSNPVPDA